MSVPKVAVLGAGPTGLATAHFLSSTLDPAPELHVFEAQPRAGGHHQSRTIEQHVFDTGCFAYSDGEDLPLTFPRLFPDLFAPIHNFQQRVLLDGKMHPFPLSPEVIFSRLSTLQKIGVAPEIVARAVWREIVTNESRLDLESWICRRTGPAIYRAAGLPDYLQKLMGLPPSELHRDLGIKRLEKIDLQTRLKALAKRGLNKLPGIRYDDSEVMSSAPPRFMYPRQGGAGSIADHVVGLLRDRGVTLHFDSPVISADLESSRVGLTWESPVAPGSETFDAVVSTIPLTHLARLSGLGGSPPRLHFKRLMMLFAIVRTPQALGGPAVLYSFNPDHDWKRITSYSEFRPTSAAESETALGIEVPMPTGRDDSPEAVLSRVLEQLCGESGLFTADQVSFAGSAMLTQAYPVLDLTHESELAAAQERLAPYPLISVGREGNFDYCFTPRCAKYGFDATQRVRELLQSASG